MSLREPRLSNGTITHNRAATSIAATISQN
jgi:hypothetical protein